MSVAFSMIVNGEGSHTIPGVLVELAAWPGLEPQHEFVDVSGRSVYAASAPGQTVATFNISITTTTPEETITSRDEFVRFLGAGERLVNLRLVHGLVNDWVWKAIVQSVSDFERGIWVKGFQCTLTGTVEMVIPEGFGRSVTTHQIAAGQTLDFTPRGNLDALVRLEAQGPCAESGITVRVGGYVTTVTGAMTAGEKLVVDPEKGEFYVADSGGALLRHVAHKASRIGPLALQPGSSAPIRASGGGATTAIISERRA